MSKEAKNAYQKILWFCTPDHVSYVIYAQNVNEIIIKNEAIPLRGL